MTEAGRRGKMTAEPMHTQYANPTSAQGARPCAPTAHCPLPTALVDGFQRTITYLRVSITDRCNLRCVYCMPAEGMEWKPREEILTYEEIARIVAVARDRGVRKVRVTGGEPLVRKGCADLIAMLRDRGIDEICLTSNGIRFAEQAERLKRSGLTRVNLSLDTLDPDKWLKDVFGTDEHGKHYGGGRKDKGGFQIPLGVFSRCNDRELLWILIKKTIDELFYQKIGVEESANIDNDLTSQKG